MPSAEQKLRTLALANPTLIADLGGGSAFKWFDVQLAPGAIQPSSPPNTVGASCVRVRRISTQRMYCQGNGAPRSNTNLSPLSKPRFQIDVLDYNSEVAKQVAADVLAFLGTVCLSSTAQFDSPALTPNQYPNFLLSQRSGLDYEVTGPGALPVYVQSLDVRMFNLETF